MTIKQAMVLMLLVCPLTHLVAQPGNGARQQNPEEIVITGDQSLRERMMAAEERAYVLFNQLNDDDRFDIRCDKRSAAGTHFERQVCEPEFMIDAQRSKAKDYHRSLGHLLDRNGLPDGSVTPEHMPAEALISSQLPDYRRKMQQVAETHPEFLQALMEYSSLKQKYESSTQSRK